MKILIIDDEPSVSRALLRAFKAKNHDVRACIDAIEGEIEWRKFEPDIVVLDILMPKMTGPQLLEKLQSYIKQSSVKIILISAHSGDYDMKVLKLKGTDLFIEKPFVNIFDVVAKAEDLLK